MGTWHDEPYASKQMGQSSPFVLPVLGPSPIPAAAIFPSAAAMGGGAQSTLSCVGWPGGVRMSLIRSRSTRLMGMSCALMGPWDDEAVSVDRPPTINNANKVSQTSAVSIKAAPPTAAAGGGISRPIPFRTTRRLLEAVSCSRTDRPPTSPHGAACPVPTHPIPRPRPPIDRDPGQAAAHDPPPWAVGMGHGPALRWSPSWLLGRAWVAWAAAVGAAGWSVVRGIDRPHRWTAQGSSALTPGHSPPNRTHTDRADAAAVVGAPGGTAGRWRSERAPAGGWLVPRGQPRPSTAAGLGESTRAAMEWIGQKGPPGSAPTASSSSGAPSAASLPYCGDLDAARRARDSHAVR